MTSLGKVLEATVVIVFLVAVTVRELLRADGGERARRALQRTTWPVLVVSAVFVVAIGRRLYELAT